MGLSFSNPFQPKPLWFGGKFFAEKTSSPQRLKISKYSIETIEGSETGAMISLLPSPFGEKIFGTYMELVSNTRIEISSEYTHPFSSIATNVRDLSDSGEIQLFKRSISIISMSPVQ